MNLTDTNPLCHTNLLHSALEKQHPELRNNQPLANVAVNMGVPHVCKHAKRLPPGFTTHISGMLGGNHGGCIDHLVTLGQTEYAFILHHTDRTMATLTANVLSSTLTKYHTDFLGMLRLSRHWMQVQPTATLFVSYTTYQSRYTRKHTVYPLAHDPKQRPQHNTPTSSANLGLTGNLLVFILPLSKHHSHTSVEFSTTSPAHVSPANLIQTPAALLIKVPPISGLRSDDLSKEVITTYDIQPMGEHRGHQIVTFYETDLHATQLNPDLPLTQCAATLPLDLLAQIAPSSRGQREEVGKRSHSLSSTSTHSSDSAGNTSEEEDDSLAI